MNVFYFKNLVGEAIEKRDIVGTVTSLKQKSTILKSFYYIINETIKKKHNKMFGWNI